MVPELMFPFHFLYSYNIPENHSVSWLFCFIIFLPLNQILFSLQYRYNLDTVIQASFELFLLFPNMLLSCLSLDLHHIAKVFMSSRFYINVWVRRRFKPRILRLKIAKLDNNLPSVDF